MNHLSAILKDTAKLAEAHERAFANMVECLMTVRDSNNPREAVDFVLAELQQRGLLSQYPASSPPP